MSLLERVQEKFNSDLNTTRVMVIGDYMLDRYIIGDVRRISPEAPIPVVAVSEELFRLGGAGNVVSNLASLGATADCFPFLGFDEGSEQLLRLFDRKNISVTPFRNAEVRTIIKARLVARKQQIARIDWDPPPQFRFPKELQTQLLPQVEHQMKTSRSLVLSDYGKGMLTGELLTEIFALAKKHSVDCFVDPKHADYRVYRGCASITPNTKEAFEATGIEAVCDETAEKAVRRVHELTGARSVFVTRAEKGITVLDANSDCVKHFPALAREVADVSGAGDTVISMLALAHELGFDAFDSAVLANIAASVVVSHFGTVPCTQVEFLESAQAFLQNHPEGLA
jgi:D-beta-D-heptose 7-phosphate kinase/D-beta-D-heptose 1-phosphate adenosyltransferase